MKKINVDGKRPKLAGRLTAVAAALLIAGCATPHDARKDAAYQEQAYAASRPVVRPTRSVSNFSESLACMDHLLRTAEVPTTLVSSKQFQDYSGRVPVAVKEMVITALSQMSRVSNAFRYVDYEVDIARQDTVQNLTTILLNTNQIQLQRPSLYFSGAVSFVDQNVLNNRHDAGVSGSRVDAAYSQSRNASIIGLEMHMGDFRTRTLLPGMDSANEVVVGFGGQGFDLAGRIGSYGVQFNLGRDYTIGTGSAVRTLVELAVIELVGKWARLPYWQCLTLDQSHPAFQRQLLEWYHAGDREARAQLVRSALYSRGYLRQEDYHAGSDSPAMRDAISRFQADKGAVVTGAVDFATYEMAMRNFVALRADGSFERVGWTPEGVISESKVVTAEKPHDKAPALLAAPSARTLNLQVENVKSNRSSFQSGEQVFISAAVSRASFLACYYSDTRGTVMRLLPNSQSPMMWAAANQAIRVPDWMTASPGFVMDVGTPGGLEKVVCFATDDDGSTRMPQELRGPALTPLQSYTSIEDLRHAYAQVWGPEGFTATEVAWHVDPTPPAAAVSSAPAQTPAATKPPAAEPPANQSQSTASAR